MKNIERIIEIPIKWRIPKIINPFGIKNHVIKLITKPRNNIFKPLLRYLNKISLDVKLLFILE